MTSGNIQIRLFLYGNKGQQVTIETSLYQDTINVRICGAGNPADDDRVTMFNNHHFADMITALTLGKDHVEEAPEFCQCEKCAGVRGDRLAKKIVEARKAAGNV
jgi:hypothetical protein